MKTSIIVLNYKGLKETLECLDSLRKVKNKNFDIIVIDNGSQDGSKEELSKISDIHFIASNKNLGYSGGNNLGIKRALKNGAEGVVILNNDTVVDPGFLNTLEEDRSIADILSPKIYFYKGNEFHKDKYKKKDLGNVIWYAGGKIDWSNIIGIHEGVDEVDQGQFNQPNEIEFATGACIFVKKEVFEKIGLFEEKYFLYLEDMDFCVRAKKADFRIFFEPRSVIWHKNASSSGGSGSALQDYYITRNRLLFAFKYAKLRTKIAVLRQAIRQANNKIKRKALIDFLLLRFGQQ